jgi:Leucine-rich repeat (LRR) protein
LGIEKRHLSYFNNLAGANHIVEINLSKNKISDINELLIVLPNIQRLIATENYIKSFVPQIKLNELTSIVLKRNLIKEINKIENIPNIEKLNLE